MIRGIVRVGLVAMALLPGSALAQRYEDEPAPRPPLIWVGGGFEVAQPVAEFANYVDAGYGAGFHFLIRPRSLPLALRAGVTFLQYGSVTRRYNLAGLVDVDVTTRNQIVGLMLGPQLTLGQGALQLYGHGGLGFSYFVTRSGAEGTSNTEPFAESTNFDDFTFAGEGGGGLLVRLSGGRVPVLLDASARFVNNGRVSYVTRNTIDFSSDPPRVYAIDSEANVVIYRLGVSVGLRPTPPGFEK